METLGEVVPMGSRIGVLVNPTSSNRKTVLAEVERAARLIDRQIIVSDASTERELETAFVSLVEHQANAVFISPDPFFSDQCLKIAGLSVQHALPAVYEKREFAEAGGLLSYGPIYNDAYRQAGLYTGRILKGEKPAELPVQQPAIVKLVINLKAARALGLTIPPTLLARADEVIE